MFTRFYQTLPSVAWLTVSGPADPFTTINENFENLSILSQVAWAFLLLDYALINCVISIVFNFYGNYLIKKFNLETKYPKLAKFILLRKKFQRYYLIFNISGILAVTLIQVAFFMFILTF